MNKIVFSLAALSVTAVSHAAPIYKCVDAQGATSFQSLPCPNQSTQSEVVLRKEPTPASKPQAYPSDVAENPQADAQEAFFPAPQRMQHATGPRPQDMAPRSPDTAQRAQADAWPSGPVSYQCTTQEGKVFYVHGNACPREVETGKPFHGSAPGFSSVTQQKAISRQEACREMRKASASDRDGYKLDQQTSTYDKLVGRDPCR